MRVCSYNYTMHVAALIPCLKLLQNINSIGIVVTRVPWAWADV